MPGLPASSMDNDEVIRRSIEDEERKQASRRVPFALFDQVHSDFTLAMATEEEDRNFFATLSSIESESDEENSSDDENESNEYEFFENQGFQAELEFPEGQYSISDEEDDSMMEEDDFDPDELTYEELLALGEFIGEESRGLSLTEMSACLQPCKYHQSLQSKNVIDRCVICQVEYENGESLVALACEHRYHSDCISSWLQIKKMCPICSTEISPPKIV